MAGYGNQTAPDYVADDYEDQHTSTRLGLTESNAAYSNAHEKHGSGTTGGAGFGTSETSIPVANRQPYASTLQIVPILLISRSSTNLSRLGNKRSSFSTSDSTSDSTSKEDFRFGSHSDTAPYSHATPLGSGSTGGAGYGNKTGSFEGSKDSTMGKVMEKLGGMLHKDNLVEQGRAKREEKQSGIVE